MFDSSSFYTSPFSYMENTLSYVLDDFTLNSKQDDPFSLASTYYHLPSPLIYNEIDCYRDLSSVTIADDSSIFEETNNMMIELNEREETTIQALEEGHEMNKNMVRKVRTSKKDRHSKIKTAHGYRDRRMRLSLEVAGPLFKLQDMLGYDKASSTIKWLLLKSKDAIDEVLRTKRDASAPSEVKKCYSNLSNSISTSDCEVESIFVFENQGTSKDNTKRRRLELSSNNSDEKEKKNKKIIRKKTSKELRDEARARARKRTLEGSMQNSKGSLKDHQVDVWINGGKVELISTNDGKYSN